MVRLGFAFQLLAISSILVACDRGVSLSDHDKRVMAIAAKRNAQKAELEKNRAAILEEVEQLLAAGKAREAMARATQYRQFSDPGIDDVIRRAQIAINREQEHELLAKIKATKRSDRQALLAYYAELEKLVPDNETYKQNWKRIQLEIYEQNEADRKKELAAERARRRTHGVSIGMTKEEVLMSNWGKPNSVNKTTTARGTREQWVYGGGNYLYFDESGRLSVIQQ